ncbi:MAG: hypothetical protein DRJ37_00665 [Thermoprotei archaeon]|nr:MAG: hypothetical protein DRJ37_00665 [Thermoprotei archaeon]
MANRPALKIALLYCDRALRLCKTARELVAKGDNEKAAEICLYISTLCIKSPNPICHRESELCKASAEARLRGEIKLAEKLCSESRRICPKNYEIKGL